MEEVESRRQGDRYVVSEEEIGKFKNDGYVHLKVALNRSVCSIYMCFTVWGAEMAIIEFVHRWVQFLGQSFHILRVGVGVSLLSVAFLVFWFFGVFFPRVKDFWSQPCEIWLGSESR